MSTLTVAGGLVVVAVVLSDSISTLVTAQHHTGRWWPTAVLYRVSWRGARWLAGRPRTQTVRERMLNAFGPLSLVGLLVVWVALGVAGWGLVWWGLRDEFGGAGVESYADAVYYAGIGFFTVGFGDIVPTADLTRLLTLVEALMGLGLVALVIGYLPSLWSAYHQRERPIADLDTLEGGVTGPGDFLGRFAGGMELASLEAHFTEWERWVAAVADMHEAYPMLMFFRSRVPGQSWIAALGVVTESAAFIDACTEGGPGPSARRLLRRSIVVLGRFAATPPRATGDQLAGARLRFEAAHAELARAGITVRPVEQAWDHMVRSRRAYGPRLEGLARVFLVPLEFHNSGPVDAVP
jgi:hypothetical protein